MIHLFWAQTVGCVEHVKFDDIQFTGGSPGKRGYAEVVSVNPFLQKHMLCDYLISSLPKNGRSTLVHLRHLIILLLKSERRIMV